ncbi:MAG: signal peptide peptidase SppA [bacterium]|nr:signal peptide peptidase SppA [bacterium]
MSSNKACCWILGIMAAGFALSAMLIGWGISQAMNSAFSSDLSGVGNVIKEQSWLVLDLSGVVPDYDVNPDLSLFGDEDGPSLHDQLLAVKAAANNEKITGIMLRPQGAAGFATLQELRNALLEFKASKKPVYAYLDLATDRDYYLASAADSIFMMPGRLGGLNFGGMAFSSTYLKRTFEHLGIQFHVIHAGRYKGAFEEFGRDSMSAELRESITGLYADVYDTYLRETAASRRNMSFDILDQETRHGDQLLINGPTCIARGYVDALVDWRVLCDRLKGGNEEFESVNARELVRAEQRADLKVRPNEIAVLYAQGEISFSGEVDGWSDDGITAPALTKQLEDLRKDDHVKAVVLRVNSPGGSAVASKQILDAVKRLQEKKPVIVSMGRVAASGGYYISASANEIVAEPNTVTGSIGVVSMFPSAEKLYEKIGAHEETISIGRWANFFRIDQTMNTEQERVLRALMDSVYLEFREDVVAGRGLSMTALDTVAEGHIWTGNQALERGLVDTLGGIDIAIGLAAKAANIGESDYELGYYPGRKDLIQFIVDRFSTGAEEFTNLRGDMSALRDPKRIVEFLKTFFVRMEYLQTILPCHVDA